MTGPSDRAGAAEQGWECLPSARQHTGTVAAARPRRVWRRVARLAAVGVLLLSLVAVALLVRRQIASPTAPSRIGVIGVAGGGGQPPAIGKPAPDLALTTLNGASLRLSDLRGKTVLLNFWATWCGPCKQEMPLLVRAAQANADQGLVVIGVDVQESAPQVRSFVQQLGVTYPIAIDGDGSAVAAYRVYGLPTTWVIDGGGVARATQLGPLNDADLAKALRSAGFAARGR